MSLGDWEIAKITKAFLGFEDHGILTIMLSLDFGGSGQGAGGYALGRRPSRSDSDLQGISLDQAKELQRQIGGVLEACGVDSWDKVQGRTILAHRGNLGIDAIKPLPTESGREFRFALPQ